MAARSRTIKVHIRWMIRRDMPEVLEIEQATPIPMIEEEMLRHLRQRNCIGMVAEHDECVIGFMTYELHKAKLQLLSIAVAKQSRRQGVGTLMIEKLVNKIGQRGRRSIVLEVNEENLEAQKFLRQMGFRATRVLRNFYVDCDKDAYEMVREMKDEPIVPIGTNRISQYYTEGK